MASPTERRKDRGLASERPNEFTHLFLESVSRSEFKVSGYFMVTYAASEKASSISPALSADVNTCSTTKYGLNTNVQFLRQQNHLGLSGENNFNEDVGLANIVLVELG